VNSASSIDTRDLELLRSVTVNGGSSPGTIVEIVVNGCAYSCCGRGWLRKDGYEQTYQGWIDNLREPDLVDGVGSFMLYATGVGTLSYVVAVLFHEVLDVQLVGA
jgi:hypothetical protein